jgi:hypothetical protein
MDSSVWTESGPASADPGADSQPLPPPAPRWILWLLWGVVLASPAFTTVAAIFYCDVETDFQELYDNGRRVIETWNPAVVYAGREPGFYPPSALPVFMLWSALPPPVSCFASCATYGLLFFLAIRVLPGEAMFVRAWQVSHAWLYLALVIGWYIAYDIVSGQVSGIPLFALIVGYVCWRRGWVWRGAAALAVGIAFKILPGLAVLFFVVKRQWKMVAATGLLSLAFGLLPGLVMFGPSGLAKGWEDYYRNVAWPKSHPVEYDGRIRWTKPASFLNPSLSVTLLRWLSDYPRDYHAPFLPLAHLPAQAVYRGYQALMVVLGAVTFWMCRRRMGRDPPETLAMQYGLVLVWMVLLSPHLAVYYMAWALWPVAVMMGCVARREALEGRPDRLNSLALWAFAASFFLSGVSTLRAVGVHPAMLLAVWGVLLADVMRAGVRDRSGGPASC